MSRKFWHPSRYLAATLVTLCVFAFQTRAGAQVGVAVNCDNGDVAVKIAQAWNFIVTDLRNNAALRANFINCIIDAQLAEVYDCNTQLNRSPIYLPIVQEDYDWQFECASLPRTPTTVTLADAAVKIDGAKMRVDTMFVMNNSVQDIAAIMAHELMHNRGFTHGDFGQDPLYSVTVPEQAAACVRQAFTGGSGNPPPYANYWDRSACCHGYNYSFCDAAGNCFFNYQVCSKEAAQVCSMLWTDATGADVSNVFPDAEMCPLEFGVQP
jgi:hypothetical protein